MRYSYKPIEYNIGRGFSTAQAGKSPLFCPKNAVRGLKNANRVV